MVGFRMACFVIWKWNNSYNALGNMEEEGGSVVETGCGGGRGGRVGCLLEVPERCSCLEGVETIVGKYIRWKCVPLDYCSGKEAVFVAVVGGG